LSKIKVYINPFDDDGFYTEFIDVTKDVVSVGSIKQQLDNTEYDVGVFRNSNVSLKMQNYSGRYSDVDENIATIFRSRRSNSKVRITWQPGNDPLICGFFNAGYEILSEEITVFEGLLNDDGSNSDIQIQDVDFKILGYESVLDQMLVPFSSLGAETLQTLTEKILDQSPFNQYIDFGSLVIQNNDTVDTVAPLQNKTVKNVLRDILLATNSIFYIKNNEVYIKSRDANPTPDPAFQFYGEASALGIENVIGITNFRSGLNKTFNFWTWKYTTLAAQDASSAGLYGIRKKEISIDIITNNTKRQNYLNANRTEFGSPRREFTIESFITPTILDLFLNDRVSADYPTLGVQDGKKVAIYDLPEGYDVDYYATELFMVQILQAERWKVLSRQLNLRNDTIEFEVREIIT